MLCLLWFYCMLRLLWFGFLLRAAFLEARLLARAAAAIGAICVDWCVL